MTEAIHAPIGNTRWQEHSLVASVCLAHFVSHLYLIILAPLLIFIRADFDVTYTEVGLAITVFNAVSSTLQTPVGFLVDRYGARLSLIAGLILGGAALVAAGLVHSYWMMIAMFGVLGLANTVYHPADYGLLSHHVAPERMGQAYSFHTFAGLLGGAVAAPVLLFLTSYVGWQGAFVAAGLLGFVGAAVLTLQREPPGHAAALEAKAKSGTSTSWRILISAPMLLNLVAFTLFAIFNSGLSTYLVSALTDLHHIPVSLANTALTTQLFTAAGGVLIGGLILAWTSRQVMVAVVCLIAVTITGVLLTISHFGPIGLIALMTFSGLASGIISPSRDMIVRSVAPPGAMGTVFGFVTNGFSIAGIVSPILYGVLLDGGYPGAVFVVVAASALLCMGVVIAISRFSRPEAATKAG